MKKIIHVSRILKWSAVAIAAALPIAEAGYWITKGYPFLEPFFQCEALPVFGDHPVTWATLNEMQKFLGFLSNLLPIGFSMAALIYLAQLFGAFERLSFFERGNVQILKKAGWALVWGQIFFPVHMACLSLTLTYCNPVGKRSVMIAWGSHQFAILAIGLAILLASWIFEEAVKLREEQEATI